MLYEDDLEHYYNFNPADYEMFPKIDPVLRTPICGLGLWNLASEYPTNQDPYFLNFSNSSFSLGQVFMRKFKLSTTW